MKSLICINTCNRGDYVTAYAYDFIKYCRENKGYDFLISSDGKDTKTIEFCRKYKIPMIYSDEREGVGISKNRVLEKFNDYNYYFFLEDDVELINGDIFGKHINISNKCGFYHMSLDEKRRFFGNEDSLICAGEKISLYDYGSASFNFFTNEGLKKVGGFHEEFSKYKRFGHTEHTYRFKNAKLHSRAFISIDRCFDGYCEWHNPPSVTSPTGFETTENRLAKVEQDIIDQGLKYYPLKTFSSYYFNGFNVSDVELEFLSEVATLKKKILSTERGEDPDLKQVKKELLDIKKSKSFRMGDLSFRSIKRPVKIITYPYNFFKILLEK